MISEAEFVSAMRKRDPSNGLILPWFTHGALDEILTWDLAGKTVLEWGGGESTAWWASKARTVATVEHDPTWAFDLTCSSHRGNVIVLAVTGDDVATYARIPEGIAPNVVCIDGLYRTECLRAALALPRPVTIIFDNWQQDFVYLDPAAVDLMAPYPGRFYVQADHRDHEGRPWQTAIWHLQ